MDARPVFQLGNAATWPDPFPMYRALRDHDPVHHVVTGNSAQRLLRDEPARRHLGGRAGPPDLLLSAGAHRQLRRAGDDRAGRQSADGHAGSPGAHRVPQAGVARVHAPPGGVRGAEGPRVRGRPDRADPRERRRGHRGRVVQTVAVDGGGALPGCARTGSRSVRRVDRRDRGRQHGRGRYRRGAGNPRRRTRRDDVLLHRAHRTPPRRTGRRHRVASGGGRGGRRR